MFDKVRVVAETSGDILLTRLRSRKPRSVNSSLEGNSSVSEEEGILTTPVPSSDQEYQAPGPHVKGGKCYKKSKHIPFGKLTV